MHPRTVPVQEKCKICRKNAVPPAAGFKREKSRKQQFVFNKSRQLQMRFELNTKISTPSAFAYKNIF